MKAAGSMDGDEMKDRVRFEEWISAPPYERDVYRLPENSSCAWPGQYKDIAVQLAWEAWREASTVVKSGVGG